MSSYWISEDWKVRVETLESYLRTAMGRGVHDHTVRATVDESGNVQFYIHPLNAEGWMINYKVTQNTIYPADPAFNKPELGGLIAFIRDREKNYRLAPAEFFSAHINALDLLYKAMKRDDQDGIKSALAELKALDEELGVDGEDDDIEEDDIEEEELIPLPPELEALPDIQAFAAMLPLSKLPEWKPISGKRIEVEGMIMILHADLNGSDGWQLTDLVTGISAGFNMDPETLVNHAGDAIRRVGGKEAVWASASERRSGMPPNPELDAIIAREEMKA